MNNNIMHSNLKQNKTFFLGKNIANETIAMDEIVNIVKMNTKPNDILKKGKIIKMRKKWKKHSAICELNFLGLLKAKHQQLTTVAI